MAANTLDRRSARERLLAAADELFYEEGVCSVGIDRVIERAGVAKASLYSVFGSKDALIRSYLTARHEARQARLTQKVATFSDPRERLLSVFDSMAELIAEPDFRGCAFQRASAEARPGSAVAEIVKESRAWTRSFLTDLSREVGAADPEHLADQLVLLYDGVVVGAHMDHNLGAAAAAREVAALLIDAATSA
jgi:AcrR family transcriptional regulator